MIPRIGVRLKKSSRIAPIMGTPRRSKAAKAPKMTNWQVKTKADIWDIGSGPWSWGGKPASRPEYITLITLQRLGWKHVEFQKNVAGGRRIPAGQILDIVIPDHAPPIYISIKSYHHEGAAAGANDKIKEMLAKSLIPGVRVLTIWEWQIDQEGWLENFIETEIGARA